MVHKLLGVFNVLRVLAHQGLDDVGQHLGNTTGDCSPTGYNAPDKGAYFMDFRESMILWGNCTDWIKSFAMKVIKCSSGFNLPYHQYYFILGLDMGSVVMGLYVSLSTNKCCTLSG